MRYESATALKAELFDADSRAAREIRVQAHGAAAGAEIQSPAPAYSLGVSRGDRRGDYRLWARVHTEAEGTAIEARAPGEVEVVVMPEVTAYVTASWLRDEQDPLVSGLSIAPLGAAWRGTGGILWRDRWITNEHVADAPIGTPVVQPAGSRRVCGVIERKGGLRYDGSRNAFDYAVIALDAGTRWSEFNHAQDQAIEAVSALGRSDIGRRVVKAGSTTGETVGRFSAFEIDGLPVNYGEHGTAWFDNIHEFVSPDQAFSQPGDSGSGIVMDDAYVALLFAGGRDSRGIDRTFACPIMPILEHAGIDT